MTTNSIKHLAVHEHIGRKVVENCGNVILREGVLSVRIQQGSLADGSITNYYSFNVFHE
jgi:hypothetical protein